MPVSHSTYSVTLIFSRLAVGSAAGVAFTSLTGQAQLPFPQLRGTPGSYTYTRAVQVRKHKDGIGMCAIISASERTVGAFSTDPSRGPRNTGSNARLETVPDAAPPPQTPKTGVIHAREFMFMVLTKTFSHRDTTSLGYASQLAGNTVRNTSSSVSTCTWSKPWINVRYSSSVQYPKSDARRPSSSTSAFDNFVCRLVIKSGRVARVRTFSTM